MDFDKLRELVDPRTDANLYLESFNHVLRRCRGFTYRRRLLVNGARESTELVKLRAEAPVRFEVELISDGDAAQYLRNVCRIFFSRDLTPERVAAAEKIYAQPPGTTIKRMTVFEYGRKVGYVVVLQKPTESEVIDFNIMDEVTQEVYSRALQNLIRAARQFQEIAKPLRLTVRASVFEWRLKAILFRAGFKVVEVLENDFLGRAEGVAFRAGTLASRSFARSEAPIRLNGPYQLVG